MTAIRHDEPTTADLRAAPAETQVLDRHLLRQQVGSAIEGYRLGCETDGLPTLTDTVDDIISTVLSAPKQAAPADRAVAVPVWCEHIALYWQRPDKDGNPGYWQAQTAHDDTAQHLIGEGPTIKIAIEAALRAAPAGADTEGEG